MAAHVSRLVVDVERFELDEREPMAATGMGCVYRLTSDGKPLRRDLSIVERESLISSYYQPHHQRFAEIVDACLRDRKIALIIDCHSFPSRPLPYELEQNLERPDVCIGTDAFHTPEPVRDAFVGSFTDAGFSVAVNRPFSGAIVPSAHYLQNRRVLSVMVEINRGLYWDEAKGKPGDHYVNLAERIRAACRRASSLVINEVNRAKI